MSLPPTKLLATPLTDLDPISTSSKSNHSATYTFNFVIFFPFSYFRIRGGHTPPVIVNHPPPVQPTLPSPYPRPIAPFSSWCHNALVGRSLPLGIARAGHSRRPCPAQGTSPHTTVSNKMSGQRLDSSRQPAEP